MIGAFLLEIGVGLLGSLSGRALVRESIKRTAPELLSKGRKLAEGLLGAGEVAGYTLAVGTHKGGKNEDYKEAFKEGLTGYVFSQAVYQPIKYAVKGVSKLWEKLPKETREKINPVKLFYDIPEETKKLLIKHTQAPQRILEVGSQHLHTLYRNIFHSEEFKEYARTLFSSHEKLKEFYEWELRKRPVGERVHEIVAFEHLLIKPLQGFESLRDKIAKMITGSFVYQDKRKSYLVVRKHVLERLIRENPDIEDELKRYLETEPSEYTIISYFPRMHVRIPKLGKGQERITPDVAVEEPERLLEDLFITGSEVLGVLKPREFGTLFDRLRVAIFHGVPFEELTYRKGSSTFRAFMSGFSMPAFMEGMLKFVQEAPKPQWEGRRFLGAMLDKNTYEVIKNLFYTYAGLYPPTQGIALGLHRFNMFLKHFVLSFSPFHATTLTLSALAHDPVVAVKGFVSGVVNAITGKHLDDVAMDVYEGLKQLEAKGLSTQFTLGLPDAFDVVVDNYQRFLSWLGIHNGFVAGALEPFVKTLAFPTKLTWDGFFRAYKLLFAQELLDLWRRGKLTDEEVVKGLDAINDIYGGNYFWRFMKPEVAETLRFLFFAPDWYVSLWKNYHGWAIDKTITAVDFIPTLARIRLYIALAMASSLMGEEYGDRILEQWQKAVHTWRALYNQGERNPLSYYAVGRHFFREMFEIAIPVQTPSGLKYIKSSTIKIEAEPEEMIGFHQLMEAIANSIRYTGDEKLVDSLNKAIGGTIGYWTGKQSSFFRMINLLNEAYRYKSRDVEGSEVFKKILDDMLPISITQYWKNTRYTPHPDDKEILKIIMLLRNFSIAYHTVRSAEYLTPKLLSENPREVEEALELIKKELPLRALKKDIRRLKLKVLVDDISRAVIGEVYRTYKINDLVAEIVDLRAEGRHDEADKLAEHLIKRLTLAVERINKSAMPSALKRFLIKRMEKELKTMVKHEVKKHRTLEDLLKDLKVGSEREKE